MSGLYPNFGFLNQQLLLKADGFCRLVDSMRMGAPMPITFLGHRVVIHFVPYGVTF
jgi:hypothetical protein